MQLPPQRPLSLGPHGGLDRSAVAPRVANRQLLGRDARILVDGGKTGGGRENKHTHENGSQ